MPRNRLVAVTTGAMLGLISTGLAASGAPPSPRDQVWAAEVAFARTMAERDARGFGEFIADEALFFSGTTVHRGKSKVIEGWASYFTGPQAPFSWAPDQVEVLDSGTLAISTGLVRDPTGKPIARFNSIWRLESPNRWRVVIDKGGPVSPGPE